MPTSARPPATRHIHFFKLCPKELLRVAVEYVVGSLPAVSIRPSTTPASAQSSVWLVNVGPQVHALLSDLLGPDGTLGVLDEDNIASLRQAPPGSVLVCEVSKVSLLALIRQLRAMPSPVPVLALCKDDGPSIKAAFDAGAYDCIVEPVSKALLGVSIKRATAHHQLINEYQELERRVQDAREPKPNPKPDAESPLTHGRWLTNVLPLDPSTKTNETTTLSLGSNGSDSDNGHHESIEQSLSPEQHLRRGHRLGEAKADFERRYLQAALAKCRGNLAAAARCSGMDRSNFRRLLKRYGLHPGSMQRTES